MKILSSLILSAVIASLALSAAPAPDIPKELATARKAYAGAVEKAVQPLRADYLRSLDRLLQDYTRAGKLEAAVAVKKELIALKMTGRWQWKSNGKDGGFVVLASGIVTNLDGSPAGAIADSSTVESVVIHWKNGPDWTIPSRDIQFEKVD